MMVRKFKENVSMALVVATIATSALVMPVHAEANEVFQPTIIAYDMSVASGSYRGTEFQSTYSLKKKNGKKVNFWISNNGKVNVKITINGSHSRILKPGENGHISASVGYFSGDYKFKAVPSPNGGVIDIDYSIAQRD